MGLTTDPDSGTTPKVGPQPPVAHRLANISMRGLFCALLVGAILLSLANVLNDLAGRPWWLITESIYLGGSENVPTWFSSLLLLTAGVMAFRCFRASVRLADRPAQGWLWLCLLLFALSCDETAELHERFGNHLSRTAFPELAESWKHTAWPLVLGPVALVVAGFFLWTLGRYLRGSARAARSLLAGAVTLLVFGIALESTINLLTPGADDWLWQIEVLVEETGEMVGAWLFGWWLLAHYEHLIGLIERQSR